MIKPRIFIGSSTEHLDIAYAIQENLQYDSESTVWTQGIFKLSKTNLDSLIEALSEFDFAIFVFHPDDITQIRNQSFETVRDNLIFELGLFMGKLGKENVFFLIPNSVEKLHLPTDLLGVNPGCYNDKRRDGNLKASLGPFCNQVRNRIKDFTYLNIQGFKNESELIKDIVIQKPECWELMLASELLKSRLEPIEQIYQEIEDGYVIQKVVPFSGEEFFKWFGSATRNFQNFANLLVKSLEKIQDSFGEPGQPGKPIEIKNSIEKMSLLCKEAISWENELQSISPPENLETVKSKLKCNTKPLVIGPLKDLYRKLIQAIEDFNEGTVSNQKIHITIEPTLSDSFQSALEDFRIYLNY